MPHRAPRPPIHHARRGFTLIEILVVVLILGILAAIVIPQFTSAASQTRDNSAKMDLHRVRQQIEVYRSQHNDHPPTDFAAQMTKASNAAGDTAAVGTAGYTLGPYIPNVPVNPFTGGRDIGDARVDGHSDWYYDPATGDFRANDSEAHWAY